MTSAVVSNRPPDSATPATTTDSPTAQTQAASSPQPSGALPPSDKAQAASENRPETAGPERADAFFAPAPAPLAAGADAPNNTAGAETAATNSHQPPSPTPARSEQVAPGKAPIAPERSAAAGSPAKDAITTAPTEPRQVDAPQTETGSQRPGSVSADDLRARQEQFENETLEKARRNTEGAINSVKSGEEELRRLDGKWFVGEARETVRKQLEYDRNTIEARQAHEETLSKNLTESRKLSDDAARLSREAQELHAVGNLELAQKKEAEASKLRGLASARLEGQSYYDRAIEEESRRNLQETNKALGKAIDHLDTAITVVEYADQGVKIAGVAAGTVIAGPAGAAAVSALYDEVKAVGTAGTEYAMGDKTLREAAQDFAGKQTGIIVDAGLAAGTAYVGGKTGEAIGKMGGNVLTKVAAGAASGSATNVAGEGIKIGAERIQAEIAFNQANPNLTGAERDAALKVFLKDRGLDGEQITHRVTAAAVSGAVTGGVSAGTANLGKVTQIAANDIAGGGTQAAQEYASTGQLTVGGVLVATAAGHLGNRMGSASRPSSLGRTSVGGTHIEPAEHSAPKQTSLTSAPHGSKQSAPLPSEGAATTVAEHDQSTAAKKALDADPTSGAVTQRPDNESRRDRQGENRENIPVDDRVFKISDYRTDQNTSEPQVQVLKKAAGAEGLEPTAPVEFRLVGGETAPSSTTPAASIGQSDSAVMTPAAGRTQSIGESGPSAQSQRKVDSTVMREAGLHQELQSHPDRRMSIEDAVSEVIDSRTRSGKAPFQDSTIQENPEIAKAVLKDTISNLGSPDLQREAILYLRRGGQLTQEQMGDSAALRDIIIEERVRLGSAPKGMDVPYESPWPRTERERQQVSELMKAAEAITGRTLELQPERAKFGGVLFDPEGTVRLDGPHDVSNGRRIERVAVLERHGPSGDRFHLHLDVSVDDGSVQEMKLFCDDKGRVMIETQEGVRAVSFSERHGKTFISFLKVQ